MSLEAAWGKVKSGAKAIGVNTAAGDLDRALLVVDRAAQGEPVVQEPAAALKVNALKLKVAQIESAGSMTDMAKPDGLERFYFAVQYNPSEISLTGEKNVAVIEDLERRQGEVAEQNIQVPIDAGNSLLEFRLYFDEVTAGDAFMADSFNAIAGLNPVDAAKKIAAMSKKRKSVKPYVDALVRCIRTDNQTKYVSFYWSRFAFKGTLERITADYTMFDTSGYPIRAEISIMLKQAGGKYNWESTLGDAFSKASAFNPVGNIVNLNL